MDDSNSKSRRLTNNENTSRQNTPVDSFVQLNLKPAIDIRLEDYKKVIFIVVEFCFFFALVCICTRLFSMHIIQLKNRRKKMTESIVLQRFFFFFFQLRCADRCACV